MISMKNKTSKPYKNNTKGEHLTFRRVARPKRVRAHIRKSYEKYFKRGDFLNDMYTDMNPAYIGWIYARSILVRSIPVILIHMMVSIIALVDSLISEQPLDDGSGTMLIILYTLTTLWGIRHAKDLMAHYNTHLITNMYDINRKVMTWLHNGRDESNKKEFAVMENFRKRFNKHILFPTVRELAVEEQLYRRDMNNEHEHIVQRARVRRSRLNMQNRELEHRAAKAVADWKQNMNGGSNEYDAMVRRYKHRTTPEIREIIDRVQGNF